MKGLMIKWLIRQRTIQTMKGLINKGLFDMKTIQNVRKGKPKVKVSIESERVNGTIKLS